MVSFFRPGSTRFILFEENARLRSSLAERFQSPDVVVSAEADLSGTEGSVLALVDNECALLAHTLNAMPNLRSVLFVSKLIFYGSLWRKPAAALAYLVAMARAYVKPKGGSLLVHFLLEASGQLRKNKAAVDELLGTASFQHEPLTPWSSFRPRQYWSSLEAPPRSSTEGVPHMSPGAVPLAGWRPLWTLDPSGPAEPFVRHWLLDAGPAPPAGRDMDLYSEHSLVYNTAADQPTLHALARLVQRCLRPPASMAARQEVAALIDDGLSDVLRPLCVTEWERVLGHPDGASNCSLASDRDRLEFLRDDFSIAAVCSLLLPLVRGASDGLHDMAPRDPSISASALAQALVALGLLSPCSEPDSPP